MSVPDITNAKQWHSAGRSKRRRRKCKTVEYISYCLKSNPFPLIMDSEDADRAFCHDYVRMNAEGHAAKASVSSFIRGDRRSPKTWTALPIPPCSTNGVKSKDAGAIASSEAMFSFIHDNHSS